PFPVHGCHRNSVVVVADRQRICCGVLREIAEDHLRTGGVSNPMTDPPSQLCPQCRCPWTKLGAKPLCRDDQMNPKGRSELCEPQQGRGALSRFRLGFPTPVGQVQLSDLVYKDDDRMGPLAVR